MALQPQIPKKKIQTKQCQRCHTVKDYESFAFSHSIFYPDHRLPICNSCIKEYLFSNDYSWDAIDKVCQWADIPFIVKEWEKICDLNDKNIAWDVYAKIFAGQEYENFGWNYYQKQYKKLREANLLEEEVPLLTEKKLKELRRIYGANYDDDALVYLDDLMESLKSTQNINGGLQIDQARKLCKISYQIDECIRAGDDKAIDKLLSSYDRLVKTAEFTPKNAKNVSDFDSAAELFMWLEKKGKLNRFYDGATRDVIDEEIKNIQNYNQKLYVNEGGLGDEITERLTALKGDRVKEDSIYDLQTDFELDKYDNDGFIMDNDEEEEFIINEDGELS